MPHVRWNGPAAIDQVLSNETYEMATVEPGHQIEVSAALRDELVARENGWTEVKDPGGAKAKAKASENEKE